MDDLRPSVRTEGLLVRIGVYTELERENADYVRRAKGGQRNAHDDRAEDWQAAADEIARLKERTARLEQSLRSVINHWDEFGPEHGFGECIDMAERALTDDHSLGEPLLSKAGGE